MKIIFEQVDLDFHLDDVDGFDISQILRREVEVALKQAARLAVKEALDPAINAARERLRQRADALLQNVLDRVDAIPDDKVLDAVFEGVI